MGEGLSQKPPQEQVRASDFCGSIPKPATSSGINPSKQPLWEQAGMTSRIAEPPPLEAPMISGVTGTMVLTPP